MQRLKKELYQGLIHFRDKHQFELKSEFLHIPGISTLDYAQEFYIFVPEALQINSSTYSKEQFYQDQTNFIRFKTPVFSFDELLTSPLSPLVRLHQAQSQSSQKAKDETKLLGCIFRSTLREEVRQLLENIKTIEQKEYPNKLLQNIKKLIENIESVQEKVSEINEKYLKEYKDDPLQQHLSYMTLFIQGVIDFHLTGLLNTLRSAKIKKFQQIDQELSHFIIKQGPLDAKQESIEKEHFQYQRSLLNTFVLDALRLHSHRKKLENTYSNIIGMTAAAIAMLIFLIGAAIQGEVFLIHSAPFIVATTFLYVIKDRVKEGIKRIYYKKATRWFPDYVTEIYTPSGNFRVGTIREVFAHLSASNVPKDVESIRDRDFHDVLESFKRPERVLYYKNQVHLKEQPNERMRRYDLNTIFRLNIHRFLEKANDPYSEYTTLDQETHELKEIQLPKVYHINIIVKNTFSDVNNKPVEQLQKFRLVIDKDGIKRVEQIWGQKKKV